MNNLRTSLKDITKIDFKIYCPSKINRYLTTKLNGWKWSRNSLTCFLQEFPLGLIKFYLILHEDLTVDTPTCLHHEPLFFFFKPHYNKTPMAAGHSFIKLPSSMDPGHQLTTYEGKIFFLAKQTHNFDPTII